MKALAKKVLKKLGGRRELLGIAESCTGGLVSQTLTEVPGMSKVFNGAIVAYANSVKHDVLKVPSSALNKYGAVSEEVAVSMARGARKFLGSDWAISLTGIAGPSGGTREKPVGLVFIAVIGPDVEEAACYQFKGSRKMIQQKAAAQALKLLLENLED
jgi:PncC family amidohydrolase